ncbi:hypothetical protein O6H91_11G074900 [Diphasiastrum complanatum]|uniref:Uncharacterized protein n=1 Tax=Diphasiastrum complanatum TaxID=34168 RepID=A0ACC2CAR1_DIPCM|nr:hypothetical protein O6H91_11G074900 [Diphasiastrum complanatum]
MEDDSVLPPYTVAMQPEEARELAQHGSSLLLLDVPPATLFGIDLKMFTTGPKFKGVKMIPPGPHFVYYSSASRHGSDFAPITGFFIYATPSKVFVRRWDLQEECLVQLFDEDEEERLSNAVKTFQFDRELGPYDVHHFKTWQHLSKYITPSTIEKLEPVGKDITVTAEGELLEKNFQTMAERQLTEQISRFQEIHSQKFAVQRKDFETTHNIHEDKQDLESEKRKRGSGRCFYTPLPRRVHRPGTPANELTTLNMDKSTMLEMVLEQHFGGSEDALMGEFQFSFIAFLMGQSLESFSQWKAFVSLMFSCEEAFLGVLYFQLKQSLSPELSTREQYEQPTQPFLDTSWFCDDNFLWLLCKEMGPHERNIHNILQQEFFLLVKTSQPIDGDLLLQARRLEKLLQSCLGWNFEDLSNIGTEDEYAPVILFEDEGMEKLS